MIHKLSVLGFIILVALVFRPEMCKAQSAEEEPFNPKIRGAIMMANSHVPSAFELNRSVIIIPTWGFDLDYFFHPRWSAAFQGDVKLQSFEVKGRRATLERQYPVALAGVLHYHALRHWSFFTGPGAEIETNESFFLVRLGTEYSFEINENFEIALNFIFENKLEGYDTWTFGVAFNKMLWEKD
jgi:hypothetical protein